MKLENLRMLKIIRPFIIFAAAMIAATGAFAQGTYTVKSGDALKVEVLEDPNLNRTVLVLPDGTINFPLVGTFQAGGKSLDSVKASLSTALATNFNAPPTVFVSIAALGPAAAAAALPTAAPTIDIFVMGEVGAPGKIAATPGITILQALAQAGEEVGRLLAADEVDVALLVPV